MMSNDPRVNTVMNSAASYLIESEVPVTPIAHFRMLSTWFDGLKGDYDPRSVELREALRIAMSRVICHIP